MLAASGYLEKLVQDFTSDPSFSDMDFKIAYENKICTTPVSKAIVAFTTDKTTIGEQLIRYNPDGSQIISKSRLVDTVVKVSIFVPYESGAVKSFQIFDQVFTKLLFNSDLKITGAHCYDSNYNKECGALELNADFTIHTREEQ